MKGLNKFTAIVISGLMTFAPAVYADGEISVNAVPDMATGSVTVSGKMPDAGKTDYVIMIVKPGVDVSEITNDNFVGKVDFIISGTTEEDGSYYMKCLPYVEWSQDEEQKVIVSGKDKGKGIGSFSFISTTTEAVVVSAVNDASADEIGKLLAGEVLIEGNTLAYYIGIDLSIYSAVENKASVHGKIADGTFSSIKDLGDALVEAINEQKALEDNMSADEKLLKDIKATADSGMDSLIRENAEKLSLDLSGDYGYEYLKKQYDDGNKEPLLGVFSELRGINKLSDAQAVFKQAVIVQSVNAADRQTVDELLIAYEKELEIEAQKLLSKLAASKKANLLNDMAADNFTALEQIKKKFNDLYDKYSKTTNNSTSGGGGGGGGSSSSFSGSAALPLTTQPSVTEITKTEFNDMSGAEWAEESVEYLLKKGIVNGYPDGSFKPGKSVTREEFATMLVSALGLYSKESSCSFSDVLPGSWYYNYVASAYEAGVVNGIDEESFGVGESITREQAAAMIYRAATVCGKNFSGDMEFADGDSIAEYAKEAVGKISGVIINGDESGCFNPKEVTTRAQAARMIHQLMITG